MLQLCCCLGDFGRPRRGLLSSEGVCPGEEGCYLYPGDEKGTIE